MAKLSMLCVATLLSLLLLEQSYRIYVFGLDAFSAAQLSSMRRLGASGMLQVSDVPELIFELRPHLDTTFKLVPFRTNSLGMRDRELDPGGDPETVRVAVVGDSFTMASGISLEDAYHSKLEAQFNALAGGHRFEFLNFGVGGYSLRQYLAVIEYRALSQAPDLILIGFTAGNDYEVPDPARIGRRHRLPPPSNPFLSSFAWQTVKTKWKQTGTRMSDPSSATPQERQYMTDQLAKIGALCRSHSIPCVLAYLWHGSSDPGPLSDFARDSGLAFVDVSAAFAGRRAKEFAILPTDVHPNAEAHAIFARVLFPVLQENLRRSGRTAEPHRSAASASTSSR